MQFKKLKYRLSIGVFLSVFMLNTAFAEDFFTENLEKNDGMKHTLSYLTGSVNLANNFAQLNIPTGFKYLSPVDAKFLMEEVYGNDPAETLGLILPEEYLVAGETVPREYFIDITWNPEGYISDKNASSLNFDDILKTLKEQMQV